jgi:hypothetical protein
MVLQDGNHLKAQALVEARCLETEGRQDDLLTPTGSRFLFCCPYELRTNPLSSAVLMDPNSTEVTTPTPRPALDASTNRLLVIADKERQPLSIVNPGLLHIVFVETIFQESDIFERRIGFEGQVPDVHG